MLPKTCYTGPLMAERHIRSLTGTLQTSEVPGQLRKGQQGSWHGQSQKQRCCPGWKQVSIVHNIYVEYVKRICCSKHGKNLAKLIPNQLAYSQPFQATGGLHDVWGPLQDRTVRAGAAEREKGDPLSKVPPWTCRAGGLLLTFDMSALKWKLD